MRRDRERQMEMLKTVVTQRDMYLELLKNMEENFEDNNMRKTATLKNGGNGFVNSVSDENNLNESDGSNLQKFNELQEEYNTYKEEMTKVNLIKYFYSKYKLYFFNYFSHNRFLLLKLFSPS